MKRVVVTFAGQNEAKAAEDIAGAVGRYLSFCGFQGAVVQIKAYRPGNGQGGMEDGRKYKTAGCQEDMGHCQKP